MNANELADAMQGVISVLNVHHEEDCLFIANEAQFMLRQQQAEIEALEQSKDRLIKTLLDVRGQQPAAWGMTWKDGEIYDVISPAQHDKEEGDYNIPLYTHPVNPYQSITDTKIEPTVVRFTYPVTEHFEDEPQAEELHEIMQSNAELTDEEIQDLMVRSAFIMQDFYSVKIFVESVLRKAREK